MFWQTMVKIMAFILFFSVIWICYVMLEKVFSFSAHVFPTIIKTNIVGILCGISKAAKERKLRYISPHLNFGFDSFFSLLFAFFPFLKVLVKHLNIYHQPLGINIKNSKLFSFFFAENIFLQNCHSFSYLFLIWKILILVKLKKNSGLFLG